MSEDRRIYVTDAKWTPMLKSDDSRLLCHMANGEEGFYHRISSGEVYFEFGTEAYCLNCAVKKGIATTERPRLREGPRVGAQ